MRDYKGFSFDFESVAKELARVTKDGGIIVWIVGDQTKDFCESLSSFKQAIFFVEQCGMRLLDTMIYQKSAGPFPGVMRYPSRFEYMFVFSKGKPKTFNPIKDVFSKRGGETRSRSSARQKDGSLKKVDFFYIYPKFSTRPNVWLYKVGKNNDTKDKIALAHPARFPEQLAEDHIISWSNKGDIIYDPFMGSGTTAKMARKHQRYYIGSEIASDYCKIAEARLAAMGDFN